MSQESELAKGYFKASRVLLCIVSVLFRPKIFTGHTHFLGCYFPSWGTLTGELIVAFFVFLIKKCYFSCSSIPHLLKENSRLDNGEFLLHQITHIVL